MMTPQQHDRLLMLLRNDNWPMADQIAVMNMVRQEFPATLRDEFAKAALAGFLTPDFLKQKFTEEQCGLQILSAAVLSYRLADEMLQARKS